MNFNLADLYTLRGFSYANIPTRVPWKVFKPNTYQTTTLGFRTFLAYRRPR
jgi:hypothetical protein